MKKHESRSHEILQARVPRDLARRIKQKAAEQDRPISNLIRNILRDAVGRGVV